MQALNPESYGYRAVLFAPGDYTGRRDGNFAATMLPQSSGTAAAPIIYASVSGLNGHITAPWDDACAVLSAWWMQSVRHVQAHGFQFNGQCLFRMSLGCIYSHCKFTKADAQPIRIRYGAHGNMVTHCLIRRDPPFAVESDVVGIQLSDDRNLGNVIQYNTILNYTDGIQTTCRAGADNSIVEYGYAAGTKIRNNFIGFTDTTHVEGGESVVGVENCIDLKVGGVPENPIEVAGNVFFGIRPNMRTPGYAITVHDVLTDCDINGNKFIDCEAGIFLNATYWKDLIANGRYLLRMRVRNNLFSGIKSHGSDLFATKQGRVLTGPNAIEFSGNRLADCDALAEVVNDYGAMTFGGNHAGDADLGPYSQTWPDASGVVSTVEETISVPFTDIVLTYLRPT